MVIIYPLGDRLLVANQIDHAAFSAELMSLWRADGLAENPRRRALIRGTREHDNGWAEADSAPRVRRGGGEDDGRPHDFRSTPPDVRLDLWQTGVRRKADDDPEAWVYVVRHARALHREEGGGDGGSETDILRAWRQALDDWKDLENELRERIGLAEVDLASDYRWLALCDLVSLAVCLRWGEPKETLGTTMQVEIEDDLAVTLHLDPFPLAGKTTFHVPCRIIPDRAYTGDADLAMELATARWQKVRVRVAP